MRWFKHLSCSSRDEKLMRLRDAFGLEGYGLYWIILEAIAEQVSPGHPLPEMELSMKSWRKFVEISPKKFEKFVSFSANLGLFLVEKSENSIKVKCPNLLKYKDEYSSRVNKKSGQTPDNVPTINTDTDTEGETEKETDKEISSGKPSIPPCPFGKIVDHLNQKTGASFKPDSKTTRNTIKARWNEGFRLHDFEAVIDAKSAEWLADPRMVEYLRPQTLFGTKFESYLQAAKNGRVRTATGEDAWRAKFNS